MIECDLETKVQSLEQEISNLISRAADLVKENETLQLKLEPNGIQQDPECLNRKQGHICRNPSGDADETVITKIE